MYKKLNDYYTNEGEPIRCWHCGHCEFYTHSNRGASYSKYNKIKGQLEKISFHMVYCQSCEHQLGSYRVISYPHVLNEKSEMMTEPKEYYQSHMEYFLKKNPQSDLLDAILETLRNV